MSANSTSHDQAFTENELNNLFYTRVAISSLSAAICVLTLIPVSIMVCCLRTWNTFVHRWKFYITTLALVLSLLYLLQVLPTKPQILHNHVPGWNKGCRAISFLLQYANWVMLLSISWVVLYLLWLAYCLGRRAVRGFNSSRQKWFEAMGIALTLTLPLLFLWVPFIGGNYGLGDVWCGIIVRRENGNGSGSLEPGLGYLIGMWYGPNVLVTLLSAVGVIVVVGLFCVYYKRNGLTSPMASAIIRGIAPVTYLVLYNIINGIDIKQLTLPLHRPRRTARDGLSLLDDAYSCWPVQSSRSAPRFRT